MSDFELGIVFGVIGGCLFTFCVMVVAWKWDARRERKMGYVTVTSFGTGYAKPYLSGPGENPEVVGLVESPRPLTDEEREEALREWTRKR